MDRSLTYWFRSLTYWFTVTRPPVESLLRRGLVVAQRGGVLCIRAVNVRQTDIISLGVGSRVGLAVRVPLLLIVVRHAVLVERDMIVAPILWFCVTAPTAADVIPTGWVVIISVRLLVRVIRLLIAVIHRLQVVANPPCVIHAVGILLKHLSNRTKDYKLCRLH